MDLHKPYSRRTFLKNGLIAAGTFAMLSAAGGLYTIFGERYWIQMKSVRLSFSKLPPAFANMRIVQFSDTHVGKYYSLKRLAHVVRLVQQQQPDMICFTGDLFDAELGNINEDIIPVLAKLKAKLGKFAVLGNHDLRLNAGRVKSVLELSGFTVLVNDNRLVDNGKGRIRVAGIDEILHGKPNIGLALKDASPDEFILLLAHEPDFADTAMKHPVALQLSGHSHGGQIRIPWHGSIFTPELGQKYSIGLYSFEGTEFHVYTNRGIGTTLLPIRFNCRPEITVFTLNHQTV